ncbi:hypothetical protein H5410_064340 [Solanum commersonii]|uniref:DUF4283 domain-containing protein n=1 Tax=Solanum commersonii TaxID=4109 RepID=A0A9J5VZL4_SOLCO|nr:hypothetical protein H5410_064340 [Solanum commersonii]
MKENLQFAIIGKFSYGKPDIAELRKAIPSQCGIKGDCSIGVLDTRHILIRLTIMEDYVHVLSSAAFYIKAKENYWQMRTLKWDPWFEPDVETTIGVAWISFPDLPPNFFAKEAIFSIASAVGRPLTVDMATKNQTRPSCARVKVEVDLTAKLPQRVKINVEDDVTGVTKSKWIKVQYDHMPKYCKECCLQGHDEQSCWTIHPELYEVKTEEGRQQERQDSMHNRMGTAADQRRTLTSGKVVGNKQNRQEWMVRRRNKYKRDRYGHIEGEIDYQDKNNFEALRETEVVDIEDNNEDTRERDSTKEWVNKTFVHKEKNDKGEMKEIHKEDMGKKIEEESKQGTQGKEADKERAEDKLMEGGGDVEINEGAIVVAEQLSEQNEREVEKDDLSQNISQLALEGDLSPKHTGQLKGKYTKQREQSEENHSKAQAASRQSKRTIVKNSKYQ